MLHGKGYCLTNKYIKELVTYSSKCVVGEIRSKVDGKPWMYRYQQASVISHLRHVASLSP